MCADRCITRSTKTAVGVEGVFMSCLTVSQVCVHIKTPQLHAPNMDSLFVVITLQ